VNQQKSPSESFVSKDYASPINNKISYNLSSGEKEKRVE
jgi:hypothetical protein